MGYSLFLRGRFEWTTDKASGFSLIPFPGLPEMGNLKWQYDWQLIERAGLLGRRRDKSEPPKHNGWPENGNGRAHGGKDIDPG